MIDKAITFATLAHNNQKRKGSNVKYIFHPLESAVIVSQMKYDEDLICAAILHDTVEDAHVQLETIEAMFNKRVADLVKAQSEDKSKSWNERKQHTIDFLKSEGDNDIKIVTLGDKLSIIRSLNRDLLNVGDKLWDRFNVKDKGEHKWYYTGLVDSLKSLNMYNEYNEFKELVTKVFE